MALEPRTLVIDLSFNKPEGDPAAVLYRWAGKYRLNVEWDDAHENVRVYGAPREIPDEIPAHESLLNDLRGIFDAGRPL